MCEKQIKNQDKMPHFYYTDNIGKNFITPKQALEIYLQYGKYQRAVDLKKTINALFNDNKELTKLTVLDLMPYAEILADLLRENSDDYNRVYSDCCEKVIVCYLEKKDKIEEVLI